MYRKKVVEVLKKQIGMVPEKKRVPLRTSKKYRVLHGMSTSFFRTLEGIVRQKLSQAFADQVFSNEDRTDFLTSFVVFVQVVSDKTVSSYNSSVLVADQVHVELLKFSKQFKKNLI